MMTLEEKLRLSLAVEKAKLALQLIEQAEKLIRETVEHSADAPVPIRNFTVTGGGSAA